ncbi:plasmid-related protein [Glaciimonas sp. CA11.2]|uniref:plasmid-related protein n=1 Tax=Glaciimonas sp. CA11.2 TaxID=3048601 RepID=UPI002AB38ED9|nr:plasmid-related protein [Glaciimonas sp. CA11.2]MDY7545506.1 plasmid-related protein [Glaciimonas sp. CA11.2]MEB0163074.1 plasmid-related protein [Glaciimonas sp. CA11.2]
MTTEELLLGKFGPYMTIGQLAEILHRSAEGLRITLCSENEISRLLKPSRVKLGRRVYFRTEQVIQALSLGVPTVGVA